MTTPPPEKPSSSVPTLWRTLPLPLRWLLENVFACLLLMGGASLAYVYTLPNRYESFVYFPAGICLGLFYRFGYRIAPGLYAGKLLYSILGYHVALRTAVPEAFDTVIATAVAVWLFRRYAGDATFMTSPRQMTLLFYACGVVIAPLISLLFSLAFYYIGGLVPPNEDIRVHLFSFFLGDAFGILLVTPGIYAMGENLGGYFTGPIPIYTPRRAEKWTWTGIGVLLLALTVLAGRRIFYAGVEDIVFLLYPMMAWAALRLGIIFTSTAVSVGCLFVFSCVTFGFGGTPLADSLPEAIRTSTFVVTITVMAQMIAVEVLETRIRDVRLAYEGLHDWVTKLPNIRLLQEHFVEHIAPREEAVLGCVSLDHFSTLMLSFGLEARNALLRSFAGYLSQELPPGVFAAHLSGGDFAVLFPPASWKDTRERAATFARNLEHFRFVWQARMYPVSPALGLIRFSPLTLPPQKGTDLLQASGVISDAPHPLDPILAAALDLAGKARQQKQPILSRFLEPDREASTRESRAFWLSELQDALEKNRFVLYGQMVVPLRPEADHGVRFEVLIRLRQSDGTRLRPDEFLPFAEQLGMTTEIDLWVLRQTLDWLERNPAFTERLALCSVNVSGPSLAQSQLQLDMAAAIQQSKVPHSKIGFEILENALLENLDRVREFSERMRGLGCPIFLDDCGSGLASFAFLKNMSLDGVKIDGSFVRDLRPENVDYAIVDALRNITGHLKIPLVAEGVATVEVRDYLREMGVEYAQGFLFGEPLELDRLAREVLGATSEQKVVSGDPSSSGQRGAAVAVDASPARGTDVPRANPIGD